MADPAELAARADIDPAWYVHIEAGRVLPTNDELGRLTTVLGGIPSSRLYVLNYRQVIGEGTDYGSVSGFGGTFRMWSDICHMLVTPEELTWFERQPGLDHRVDVFMNMSCGTQNTPHLLLDTVSVLDTLGVSFVAAAGTAACCGKPFRSNGRTDLGERMSVAHRDRSRAWGAQVHVNWCTACQVTSTVAAARRELVDGVEHPVREVQVLTFLDERIRELGDRVPWKKEVRRRVLAEGHAAWSPVHREAHEAVARLLALVPGVEVVGFYDGFSDDSPCTARGREPDSSPPAWVRQPQTPELISAHRTRLADQAQSRGADTISCQHQGCHLIWSRYASERLEVRHAVSILAEALGCVHPDRFQAAARLGSPEEFVAQTRSIWQSWGMSEDRALELAQSISDPTFADQAVNRSCGGDGPCQNHLIPIDVVAGV
ncbi:MAG: heterodisulfide reductase-related iron-sulfur binding cluster [Acidimicrobiales bacterium]